MCNPSLQQKRTETRLTKTKRTPQSFLFKDKISLWSLTWPQTCYAGADWTEFRFILLLPKCNYRFPVTGVCHCYVLKSLLSLSFLTFRNPSIWYMSAISAFRGQVERKHKNRRTRIVVLILSLGRLFVFCKHASICSCQNLTWKVEWLLAFNKQTLRMLLSILQSKRGLPTVQK